MEFVCERVWDVWERVCDECVRSARGARVWERSTLTHESDFCTEELCVTSYKSVNICIEFYLFAYKKVTWQHNNVSTKTGSSNVGI
jgi:hypothetical protein